MTKAQLSTSPDVIAAFRQARMALKAESGDAEYEALLLLIDALDEYDLTEWCHYHSGELVEDFIGWAGLDRERSPDLEQIDAYVTKARPADSDPAEVKAVLLDYWDFPRPLPEDGKATNTVEQVPQELHQQTRITDAFPLEGIRLKVPTYNGKWIMDNAGLQEFDEPEVPILICPADGLRIVLGTHDYHDYDKPDIQVERRHNGWMFFLHAVGGGDPSGFMVFLDDGRSFVTTDSWPGSEKIEMVDWDSAMAELDDIKPDGISVNHPTVVPRVVRDE